MPMKNRILNTHTNFSDISTSQTAANQPNDFLNTHTWRYHRSHRRSRKIFFECTSRRTSFPSETEYILLPSTRILQILSTHKERRSICAQQISKLRTFRRLPEGYAVSDEQAHGKNSEGYFRRKKGRKEERMKEGRRKEEKNWLVTGRNGFALSVYDLFCCSRRDCHCVCITPGLSRVIGAFGPGVCTLAVCRTRD